MTTGIEERLSVDLARIAGSIKSEPRPLEARSARRPRGHRSVAVGVAALALFGGGVVLAATVIPDDVERGYNGVDEYLGCGIVLRDEARVVATVRRADGNDLEMWVAPTSTASVVAGVRVVSPDGTWLGTAGGCGHELGSTWASASTEVADGQTIGIVDVRGHTNSAVDSVVVRFSSGATVNATVQSDGYFLASLRDQVSKYETDATVDAAP